MRTSIKGHRDAIGDRALRVPSSQGRRLVPAGTVLLKMNKTERNDGINKEKLDYLTTSPSSSVGRAQGS